LSHPPIVSEPIEFPIVIGVDRWTAEDGPPTDIADGKPAGVDNAKTEQKSRIERAGVTAVGQGAGASWTVPLAHPEIVDSNHPTPKTHANGNNIVSNEPHFLTTVQTLFRAEQCNHRVLFGVPFRRRVVAVGEGHSRELCYFAPGARFGLDLWIRNAYGSIQWRCFVCQAIKPGTAAVAVPFVVPAATVLLHTKGAAQSRLFLEWLTELEESGIDPLTCPAATFEAAHFRLQGSRADRTPARRLSGRP
jgi:hypothetical protein